MAGPLSDRLAALADDTRMEAALRLVGEAWAAAANEAAPVGANAPAPQPDGTPEPRLHGAIRFEVESPTRGALVLPHHALYVLQDTAPHLIRPRAGRTGAGGRGAALRFSVADTPYFARVVHHPGTRRQDFVGTAWRSATVQAALRSLGGVLFKAGP